MQRFKVGDTARLPGQIQGPVVSVIPAGDKQDIVITVYDSTQPNGTRKIAAHAADCAKVLDGGSLSVEGAVKAVAARDAAAADGAADGAEDERSEEAILTAAEEQADETVTADTEEESTVTE